MLVAPFAICFEECLSFFSFLKGGVCDASVFALLSFGLAFQNPAALLLRLCARYVDDWRAEAQKFLSRTDIAAVLAHHEIDRLVSVMWFDHRFASTGQRFCCSPSLSKRQSVFWYFGPFLKS